jgi:phosphotransferase system, enzyme I, PtsP
MLSILRRIVQEVNTARDLDHALSIIVSRVKQAMKVDVCSVYLLDPVSQHFVLMASDGFRKDAIGNVRLKWGQGLVSVVGATEEPLNLANAPDHPRYLFVAETGEELFHAFLGVPIIQHRKVMGVLIVRQHEQRRYDEDEVAFLLTIAAQLAGAIAHAEASGGIKGLADQATLVNNRPITALPGAPGVALGFAVVVYPLADLDVVPDRRTNDIQTEVEAFETAVAAVRNDIRQLETRVSTSLDAEDRALFNAYQLMLNSDSLINKTIERILGGNWAPGALRDTINEHARVFDEMDDTYMRERAGDVRDLGRRILLRLQSDNRSQPYYPPQTILVGEEITASMLAEVPVPHLAGVVSARGSSSSHVAILAHALGIPAVVGASDLPIARVDGCELIIDGYRGQVYVSPSSTVRDEFTRLANEEKELSAGLEELRGLPAVTLDDVYIPLYANTGLLSDITPSRNSGADGIGLYRTEFPFMTRDRFPSEEEQCSIYRQVLEAFAPRPVTLRTLDIGGDKALSYFPISEENPFLGWRGIRVTLDHPEIFLVQLRAMMRASVGLNNLNLLLPMISHVAEVDEAQRLIKRLYSEMIAAGVSIEMPKVGLMIEVPSAVYQIDALAKRVDFVSVGTNDLTQYLLAVDRNNPRVAALYDSMHPSVLNALTHIIEGARRQQKPVSVCGEMAGEPAAALLLLGMGVTSLSSNVASLLRVKWVIRNFSVARAREVLDAVIQMEDAKSVRLYVGKVLEEAGLGGLIRAGK